ncbi:unnamed protein product, partial [Closterium sp. NIES-54]
RARNSGEEVQRRYQADCIACTQWTARDTVAQLAVRARQRAHFRHVTSAQPYYDAVVWHYSSLSPATLGRLALPFLLPDLTSLAYGGGGFGGGQQQRHHPLF